MLRGRQTLPSRSVQSRAVGTLGMRRSPLRASPFATRFHLLRTSLLHRRRPSSPPLSRASRRRLEGAVDRIRVGRVPAVGTPGKSSLKRRVGRPIPSAPAPRGVDRLQLVRVIRGGPSSAARYLQKLTRSCHGAGSCAKPTLRQRRNGVGSDLPARRRRIDHR